MTVIQNKGNLQWLAGFIDADGTIGIHRQIVKHRNAITWVPEIAITTVCTKTANHIDVLLKTLNIPCYRLYRKVTQPNWTDRHHLELRGMKKTKQLLPLILPYLVTKQREAELVIEFINLRKTSRRGSGYSDQEMSIIYEVKALKCSRNKTK